MPASTDPSVDLANGDLVVYREVNGNGRLDLHGNHAGYSVTASAWDEENGWYFQAGPPDDVEIELTLAATRYLQLHLQRDL